MKKNNFKKILVVFSLCVFLLSIFSVSSFALNISDVSGGYLYKLVGPLSYSSSPSGSTIDVEGYIVNKTNGDMTPFSSLVYGVGTSEGSNYYYLNASTSGGTEVVVSLSGALFDVYIDYSKNTVTRSAVEAVFSKYFDYTITTFSVPSMFNNVNIALTGGTNADGSSYDGLLGMVSRFGKFLVSSPLLLVLCIALPLVSFSVGLIIRIKNRA